MIEILEGYEDLIRFVADLEKLCDKGMTRFRIHGFQKHVGGSPRLLDLDLRLLRLPGR